MADGGPDDLRAQRTDTAADGILDEATLRALIEHVPVTVYIDRLDERSSNVYTSPQLEALLGYTVDEWMTDEDLFLKVLHPDDRDRVMAEHHRTRETGEPFRSVYRMVARDGTVRWFLDEAVAARDDAGRLKYQHGFLLDITQQKELEDALRRREDQLRRQKEYYEALIEASPTAIVTIDTDATVTSWNPAAELLFGYTRDEAIGHDVDRLVANSDEVHAEAVGVTRQLRTTGQMNRTTRRTRRDGSLVDVDVRAAPIRVAGETVGLYALYHDISELQQARAQAESATQAKSAFLATMSHEIRTPMNAVIGMTELLLDTDLTTEQQRYAEIISSSGDALMTIIDDILDFSKIEAGRLELERRPFDLRACVESALELVAANAASKGLDVAYLYDAAVPDAIVGDEARLRQILVNLLNNAVKFTDTGEVVLAVDDEELPHDDAGTARHRLHFTVRDTGIGIPPDRMSRLFESFSQVDASTTRRYGGTGLGLAISKRLCELMGGTMWAESEVGHGSTFHFAIEASDAPGTVSVRPGGPLPQLAGKRVLVVDDNATNRFILVRQTAAWGMVPRETAAPAEALDWIRRGDPFDVALLDMQMPGMDGIALAAEIRRHRDAQALPLVLVTSLGHRHDEGRVSFVARLTKPIRPSQLYDTLLEVFGTVATPEPAVEQPDGSRDRPARPDALRVLVAEDNPVNQQLAVLLVGRLGHHVDVASNGREALDALDRAAYDVVLMDVQMPEMDGLEATRRIHERWPEERRPRIIAATANALHEEREACLAAGMDDYLSKPIRREELAAALRRTARERRPQPASSGTPDGTGHQPPARVAPAAAPAELDRAALDRLRETMGADDPGVLAALLDTFAATAPELVDTVARGIAQEQPEVVRRAAHTLKSNAAVFGATDLSDDCRELEALARTDALEGADAIAARIAAEYPRVAAALALLRKEQDR